MRAASNLCLTTIFISRVRYQTKKETFIGTRNKQKWMGKKNKISQHVPNGPHLAWCLKASPKTLRYADSR